MEQIKKVKMAIKLGLTSILETFWAIGTSTVARDVLLIKKHENTTMCIVHKGFRGFRAVSPALIFGSKMIGLKPAIPYDTIHSTLAFIVKRQTTVRIIWYFCCMKKKENKEIATAQMAHLVFADTQPNAEKTKRAISCLRTTER